MANVRMEIRLAFLVLLLLLTLHACSSSSSSLLNNPVGSAQLQAITVGDAIAELEVMETPSGVTPELFSQLKEELIRQLKAKGAGKATCTPPLGVSNMVSDLASSENEDGRYTFTWSYMNQGDYDQNGTVGVSDITPIALHYGETAATETLPGTSIQGVIDTSKSGVVDIADVTAIAANFTNNCSGYQIQMGTSASSAFIPVRIVPLEEGSGPGRLSFSVTMNPANYQYVRVAPFDIEDEVGIPSGHRLFSQNIGPPNTPSNLLATDGSFTDKIRITWDGGASVEYYNVYRADSETGDYVFLAQSSVDSYDDETLTDTAVYWYKVTAHNTFGDSEYSNADSGYMADVPVPPAPPTNLAATDGLFTDNILVSWTNSGADSYEVYRSDNETGTYSYIGETSASPYNDNSIVGTDTYWYMAKACNDDGGESEFSNADSGYKLLPPPTNLKASDGLFADRIQIGWIESPGASGYKIYKAETESGDYQFIGESLSPLFNDYINDSAVCWYRARAYDENGTSDFSNADSGYKADSWHLSNIQTGFAVFNPSLANIGGKPAISYMEFIEDLSESATKDLKYVRANDSYGTDWGAPVTVDSDSDVGTDSCLTMVNGYPAILYINTANDEMMFVRATDSAGNSWGTPVVVASNQSYVNDRELAVVNGRPAISYAVETGLYYTRAADANGDSWNAPVNLDSIQLAGCAPNLLIVNGKPAIAYESRSGVGTELKYTRSEDVNGDSWSLPQIIAASQPWTVNMLPSMTVINGNPAVSYLDGPSISDLNIYYIRATDSNGDSWGPPVTVDNCLMTMVAHSSLVVIGDLPAVSFSYHYSQGNAVVYAVACDVNGDTWGDISWVDAPNSAYWTENTSAATLNGKLAIAYYEHTYQDVRFAVLF